MNKILIVEDDFYLSKNIRLLLEKEGYEVITADSCTLAKVAMEKELPDLCLADIMLPDGNGFELCSFIRQRFTMPVIVISARDDEESIVRGLELGADDYVTKPFKPKELLSRIRANLRRAGLQNSTMVYVCDGLELDVDRHLVRKNGEVLELRNLEYRLLECFMKQPEIVLKRTVLLEHIWDKDGNFIEDNTLSVTMKRLREKIGETPDGKAYIETIRSVGYRWNLPVSSR